MAAAFASDSSVFGGGAAPAGAGAGLADLAALGMSLRKVASSSTMGTGSNGVDDEDDVLSFESPREEADYYRDKYRTAVDLLNETRAELDEFQISSHELEAELERELESTEKRQAELQDRIKRLQGEKEDWKTKYVALQKTHGTTTAAMQREMDNLRSERDKALVAVRDLEMGNDQLERNERVAVSSLLDMEIKYNRAIEEKTLLEQEVIQRNEVEEECQRLKDDVRDANNEIAILRDQLARSVVPTPPASDAPMSPATDRVLHSRSTSRSHSVASRLDGSSPTPTDRSSTTERSAAATERNDPHGAPRAAGRLASQASPRRLPRSTSTPLSPASKRTPGGVVSSPSSSGIPALARSTARHNLAGAAQTPGAPRRALTATTSSNAAPATSAQQTKNKAAVLLHNLQARMRTTDDKIGKMVKRPAGFARRPTPASGTSGPIPASSASSVSSTSTATTAPSTNPLSVSTMRARTRTSSTRANNLAMSSLASSTATVTPTTKEDKSVGFLSPSSWVLLSDAEESISTPPATTRATQAPRTPGSPSSRTTTRRNNLPTRPAIPSPLIRETKARHINSETTKIRHGLSASSIIPPTPPTRRERPPLSVSTSTARAPSRSGHVRSASSMGGRTGAVSPFTLIPGASRRLSTGPRATLDLASPTTATGLASSRTVSSTSASTTGSRPPSRAGAGGTMGPRSNTPTAGRAHMSSGSLGGPLPPVPPRRATRRSSVGLLEEGMPPSAIPAPKTSGGMGAQGRPTSFPSSSTPPPPVPRIPSQMRYAAARSPL